MWQGALTGFMGRWGDTFSKPINPVHKGGRGGASNHVIVSRNSGKPRFCVVTENQMPRDVQMLITSLPSNLESLAGATVFSSLDLNRGYWQVEMDPDSQAKTAFICPYNLYQFNVMPFGLKNAPATFQRLMEMVLWIWKGCTSFVYLDYIVIYSDSWQQHFKDVHAIMDKLRQAGRQAGLTVNVKKSNFLHIFLTLLGHVLSSEGVQMDPEKMHTVQNFTVPTNRKSLEQFLGMARWYHGFVPS